MGKKFALIIVTALVLFFVLTVFSQLIIVLSYLDGLNPWVDQIFLVILVGVLIWLVVLPIIKLSRLKVFRYFEANEAYDDEMLKEASEQLINSEVLDPVDLELMKMSNDHIFDILEKKEREVDQVIEDVAILTFLTTALSPNGTFDALAILYYNFNLMTRIMETLGIRPTPIFMLKMMKEVFLTAFIVNQFEDLDIEEYVEDVLESSFDSSFNKILSKFASSLVQGMTSAYVTLKIGYATKAYLLSRQSPYQKETKRRVKRKARKNLFVKVLPKTVSAVPKNLGKVITVLTKKATSEMESS